MPCVCEVFGIVKYKLTTGYLRSREHAVEISTSMSEMPPCQKICKLFEGYWRSRKHAVEISTGLSEMPYLPNKKCHDFLCYLVYIVIF